MVKIRLMRMGAKKRPFFRVVVADSRSPRDGRFIENIGKYHPLSHPSVIEIDQERALHWLQNGAQPSDPVKVLLQKTGIWERFSGEAPPPPKPEKPSKRKAEAAPPSEAAAEPPEEASASEGPEEAEEAGTSEAAEGSPEEAEEAGASEAAEGSPEEGIAQGEGRARAPSKGDPEDSSA
jgi:small subunit ribosomal protein S16